MSKRSNKHHRPQRSRPLRRRLLIVTEDSDAAPTYFREIVHDAGLPPAQVLVEPSPGSDPLTVVRSIKEIWEAESRGLAKGETPFERTFALLDSDEHPRLAQAREELRQMDENVRSDLTNADKKDPGELCCFALSIPCFEYWLLIHFEYTRAPFVRAGDRSPCDTVISRLKAKGLDHYKKGELGLWQRTKHLYEGARQHAERARNDVKATGSVNPSTQVDRVVEAIFALK